MNKMTSGIIYTIKQNGYSREEVAKFMHYYTDTPIEYYTDEIIDRLMEKTMVEAIRSNENPASIVSEYFYWRHSPWNYSNFKAICAALYNIEVQHDNKYINGFWSIEDFGGYFKMEGKYESI